MQYAAEVTYPTPEGTSNGLIQLFGQSAVVFVYVMEALRTSSGSFTPSLLLAAVLLAVGALVLSRLKDAGPMTASGAAAGVMTPAEGLAGAMESSALSSEPWARPACWPRRAP